MKGLRLPTTNRSLLAAIASGLVAWLACFSTAHAQNVDCRKTETEAECHARLRCHADEEVEDCQKRLLKCSADEDLATCKKHAASSSQPQQQDRNDRSDDRDRDRNDRDDDRDDDRSNRNDRDDRDDRDDDRNDRGDRYDSSNDRRGQRGRRRGGRGRNHRRSGGFEANKTFGLGLELGEPTGLNGKYFFGPRTALDFGIGAIYDHYYYGDGIHLYGDILFHPTSLASTESFELPFYIGGGLRYWNFDYCYQGVCDYGGSAIGIRIPIGISFDFNNVPLDIFLQIVPTIDFIRGDYYDRYRDRNHFGIDGSVGIRFWFK